MSTSDRPIPDDIEPVQAVLVARLDGPAARLQAKRAVFAVFFAWTPGGSLRERAQRGHALITRRDLAEAERQQSRLTLLVNIALAVGGPPPSALRPSRGAERDGDPLVALFFRTSPGPASLVARRHAARKLKRFEGMQLARMQDIGGLRAVVSSIARVRRLEAAYRATKFDHTLAGSKNYIDEPKEDGYRSAHLIYRYKNPRAPQYDGLSLELQLRTQLQHAWATAVETMSTFLGQALKSGQGERSWRQFFEKASAALALVERTAPVPGSEGMTREEVFADLAGAEHYYLRVLEKLEGFAIAADQITAERGQGAYHLIVLNSSDRTVTIRPYAVARLEEAAIDYADMEERTRNGEPVEAVLVSAGPIDALRKAYPNYFLDTQVFVGQIRKVIATVPPAAVRRASRIAEERAATEPQQTEMLLTAS